MKKPLKKKEGKKTLPKKVLMNRIEGYIEQLEKHGTEGADVLFILKRIIEPMK